MRKFKILPILFKGYTSTETGLCANADMITCLKTDSGL